MGFKDDKITKKKKHTNMCVPKVTVKTGYKGASGKNIRFSSESKISQFQSFHIISKEPTSPKHT